MQLADPPTTPTISVTFEGRPSPIDHVEYLGEFIDARVEYRRPHLSPSHLRDRFHCAAQNWFVRAHGMAKARAATMLRGTGVHYGISKALDANRTTIDRGRVHPIDLKTFLEIAQHHAYRKTLSEMQTASAEGMLLWDKRWQKGPQLTPQTLLYDVYRAIKHAGPYFYENVYPIAIEAAFVIFWKRAHIRPLLGIADVIDLREDSTLGVRDVKTSIKKKTLAEVAFDRALTAYGGATTDVFGIPIATIGYENITYTSPGRGAKIIKPAITHYTLDLPYEPATVETIEIESADAMLDLNDERVTPRRGVQTCTKCAFTRECSDKFGPLHSFLLTSPESDGDDTDA